MRETAPLTPRCKKKEGEGGAPGVRADIPLQTLEKTALEQIHALKPISALQLMEDPMSQWQDIS